jgi:hypothetical protein
VADYKKALIAFEFLRKHAESQTGFDIDQLASAAGWTKVSARTYINKKWKDYLREKKQNGKKIFTVQKSFLRLTQQQFLAQFTQKETIRTAYERAKHVSFVQFEFLLPLTREDKLRRALDDLFYKDTMTARLHDIGLENMVRLITREEREAEEKYVDRVCHAVAERFGGYSVTHVQGRYKAWELLSRREAGDLIAEDKQYLIDETTAVVRFIVPCRTGRTLFADDFDSVNEAICEPDTLHATDLQNEVALVRALFFHFFVEAVVGTVQGEEEIWLLESGHTNRLYRWMRAG